MLQLAYVPDSSIHQILTTWCPKYPSRVSYTKVKLRKMCTDMGWVTVSTCNVVSVKNYPVIVNAPPSTVKLVMPIENCEIPYSFTRAYDTCTFLHEKCVKSSSPASKVY